MTWRNNENYEDYLNYSYRVLQALLITTDVNSDGSVRSLLVALLTISCLVTSIVATDVQPLPRSAIDATAHESCCRRLWRS